MECPPEWRWRRTLSDFDLWLVLKGSGQMHMGGAVFEIGFGTLLLLRPGDDGWAIQDPDDRLTVIYMHLDFYEPGLDRVATVPERWLPDRHVQFSDTSTIEPLLLRVIRLIDSRQPLAEFEAGLVLRQVLLHIYRQDAANHDVAVAPLDPRLERVMAQVRNAPGKRLTLRQCASGAHLSATYFSRLFRKEMGMSFREYTVRIRLERARLLLEETDMSITRIAESLGYTDLFVFSRQFKQHYGVPPSAMRRSPGINVT
jgi:AraC-like DNA-binding protein